MDNNIDLTNEKLIEYRKKTYIQNLRTRNKNLNPTIIASNCVGGVMYNTLGLKYCSPTINLKFGSITQYVCFCKDVKYYTNCQLTDISSENQYRIDFPANPDYPIGLLAGDSDHPSLIVHFGHHGTFDEAKQKWIERSKRINYDNMFYVIYYHSYKDEMEALKEFDSLPVSKMCILDQDIPDIQNKVIVSIDNYFHGKILEYQTKIPWKRYLDEVDYVSFLNNRTSWKIWTGGKRH